MQVSEEPEPEPNGRNRRLRSCLRHPYVLTLAQRCLKTLIGTSSKQQQLNKESWSCLLAVSRFWRGRRRLSLHRLQYLIYCSRLQELVAPPVMMDTAVTTQTPCLQFKTKWLLLNLKVVSQILYLSQTFSSLYLFLWSKWVVWNHPPILTTQLCENTCGLTAFRITSPGSEPITAAFVLSQHNWTRNANASTHRDRQLRTRTPFFWDTTLSNRIPTLRATFSCPWTLQDWRSVTSHLESSATPIRKPKISQWDSISQNTSMYFITA